MKMEEENTPSKKHYESMMKDERINISISISYLSTVFLTVLRSKKSFLFKMLQKGPDGPKMVPNDQKHLG